MRQKRQKNNVRRILMSISGVVGGLALGIGAVSGISYLSGGTGIERICKDKHLEYAVNVEGRRVYFSKFPENQNYVLFIQNADESATGYETDKSGMKVIKGATWNKDKYFERHMSESELIRGQEEFDRYLKKIHNPSNKNLCRKTE